ncbi:MAG: PUA domain-containing protein [Candidatus Woesearchaeota archaeon]
MRKSEIRELNEELLISLDKKASVELVDDVLLVNDTFYFFKHQEKWVASVRLLLERPELLPHLVVDMGAVRFVANGADIMRPGITSIPEGKAGMIVAVVDENNHKPFAVGEYNVSSQEMQEATTGSVIKNIHYVGDEKWKRYVTKE